ncbi:MAG: tRNA (adenosine(37)-N6)-dimethylallyltransferase MiaA, partial [Candidatus Omnitrophica bacterium]|nr:tRNA (adenosine(37)-N6)-dimethylallyltransferase MiaA [Candidatus Omnitrophota bacterium]
MPIKMMGRGVLLFIVGPTAIGKTALSVKLAGRIKGEVISADSMQVYKGMRILSQSPGPSEKGGVKHHLVGVIDPGKEYSVASFCKAASAKAASILKRKKIPVIVGGSGLYVRALIDGLFPSPPADVKFRSSMQRFIAAHGSGRLHKKLSKIDPEAAAGIHPNDARRII